MAQNQYQEPIEKEDLDLAKKIKENIPVADAKTEGSAFGAPKAEPSEAVPETPAVPEVEKAPGTEAEPAKETKAEEVSEKIETARKTITAQTPAASGHVAADAEVVADIAEYEKRVEKLMELALAKGPDHAISVARHLNKAKTVSSADNFTLDELHDRMEEEDLRKQLIAKGLLKEL